MHFDLEELRTFVLVVETSSMSAAARALRVTVNAVSRRVLRLEEQVGVRLLHRTTRAVAVTEEGRRLYAHAKRLAQVVEEIGNDLRPHRDRIDGSVRVAVPVSALDESFLRHFATALQAHPRLNVQLVGTHGPIDPVGDAVDLEVFVGTPPTSSRLARALGHVAWVLAASPRYLDLHGHPDTPSSLARHRCLRLLSERVQGTWELSHRDGRKVTVPVGGSFECNDSRALGEAIYAGIGVGIRPERDVDHAQGRIIRVLPDWHFGPLPVFLLTASKRGRAPRIALLASVLTEAFRDRLIQR